MYSADTPFLDDDTASDTASACRAVLLELMEIGMTLARSVRDEAQARDAGAQEVAHAVAAFERVSRAVRRTVRMVRWLDEAPAGRTRDGGRADRLTPDADRVSARKGILRAVEDRIDRVAEAGEAEALHAELLERMDAPELEREIAGRPVVEIIGEICRDLGLDRWPETHPSLRRRPADVTALHRRAEAEVGATRMVGAPVLPLAQWERAETDEPDGVAALPDVALDEMNWRRRGS